MGVLLLTVVIALAVEVRASSRGGHGSSYGPKSPLDNVCGYNCTKEIADDDDQFLRCWAQDDIVNRHGRECEGAPSMCECCTGFNQSEVCGQLCKDINECENPMRCGRGLDGMGSGEQCINTIGGHLCIGFPDMESAECSPGDITLLRGRSLSEGLLAMCYEGEWILPCSDNWTETDASVACRQLGFEPGELQPQNDVYSDKIFRYNGDESSLEEFTCDTEFSGICHHVNLSCYNPTPLSPIEVCLPANTSVNDFTTALAKGVSESCSCVYTTNEIRFRAPTVSCPDGQPLLKYEIGNYHILPDGIVQDHIQQLSPTYGILDQCPKLQADCNTSDAPLVAILVPIIAIISLLLVAAGIIVTVVMIRKRRFKRTLQPQDETKTPHFDNPTYRVTVLPHPDSTYDSADIKPERIVINTSPVAHPTNEAFLVGSPRYEQAQLREAPPAMNSQGEYAEIDDHSHRPQPYEVPVVPADDTAIPEGYEVPFVPADNTAIPEGYEVPFVPADNTAIPEGYEVPVVPADDTAIPEGYEVPFVPADITTTPEGTSQGAYAVLNQQKAQYATLEPTAVMGPQGTQPDKDGYSHLQH